MSNLVHPVEQFVSARVAQLQDEEALLRRRGLVEAADLVGSISHELTETATAWLDEAITLQEAADLSGCSYSTIESQLRVGKLCNAGEKGRPRVRRRDLPYKRPANPPALIESTFTTGDPDSIDDLVEREIVVRASALGDPDFGSI